MATVSVILATLTQDGWFKEAIGSILQDRSVDLELIVVLDGPSDVGDRTWEKDPRVHVIEIPEQSGLANALYVGIQHSSSKYIARLDADDLSTPLRLSAQLSYLESHSEVGLLGTHGIRIDENGKPGRVSGRVQGKDVRSSLIRRNVLLHSSVMFRREAYDKAGGYNPLLRQMEDYDLWLRIALDYGVAVMPQPLVRYRVHSSQMSRGARPSGDYIRCISRGQFRLARKLGLSVWSAGAHVAIWRVAQYLRFYGLRRIGYDR